MPELPYSLQPVPRWALEQRMTPKDNWPYAVRRNQLEITFMRGTGKGGQKRNKTSSACRIVHIPTDLSAYSEAHREQSRNRDEAFKKLAAKLVPIMKEQIRSEVDRSNKGAVVRTYHAIRRTVKDHRLSSKVFKFESTLDGDLDPIITEVLKNG